MDKSKQQKIFVFTKRSSIKKLKIVGFLSIIFILAAIPFTIFILNTQTKETTKAASPTTFPTQPFFSQTIPSVSLKSDTFATVTVLLPGIGSAPFNNLHPLHPTRSTTLTLYNTIIHESFSSVDTVTFDGNYFTNQRFKLGSIPTGTYQITITIPQYIKKTITKSDTTDIFSITSGTTVALPTITLLPGDIAPIPGKNNQPFGDGIIDINDYNILYGCYSGTAPPSSCNDVAKLAADLNDDGKVGADDYNLFLKSLSQQANASSSAILLSPTPILFPQP